jgi:two-component system capsular synthesis sensor histidine kinase RcsC
VRILIMDDHEDSSFGLGVYLHSFGYDVERVNSAESAYQSCMTGRFDALIADIALPGEDGFHLLARLRTGGSDVPAIALTGWVGIDVRRKCAEAGFLECLLKPRGMFEVPAAIERHVNGAPASSHHAAGAVAAGN